MGLACLRSGRQRGGLVARHRSLLALFFNFSKTFGDTYGSLAGLVALQLWTFFSALAILYGVAVAAQLEAVRAGVPEAQDLSKDEASYPEPVSA